MGKNIIIWGYGYEGLYASEMLFSDDDVYFWGFADNNKYMTGYYSYGQPIRNMEMVKELKKEIGQLSVLIASKFYFEIANQCIENDIDIEGFFINRQVVSFKDVATFQKLDLDKKITLFAGDIGDEVNLNNRYLFGLSINKWDKRHIYHDITNKYPLPNDCIDTYISENVFEFIDKSKYVDVINEIYRILKKNGRLRISMPDYNSPFMKRRSMTNKNGDIIYDARENVNIKYGEKGLIGGTLFFSTYENFKPILEATNFNEFKWMRYYLANGEQIKEPVDLKQGYLWRNDKSNGLDDYNIVVDCIK